MIREIVRPKDTSLTIEIPTSYIGRDVEIIMFPLAQEEVTQSVKKQNKQSLRGVFSQYADATKITLEDTAWQNKIISEFKEELKQDD